MTAAVTSSWRRSTGRLRQPGDVTVGRRRAPAPRRLHDAAGALRPAGQPAHAGRAGRLQPVPRARSSACWPMPAVFLALGAFAYDCLARLPALRDGLPRPRPRFAHGTEVPVFGGGPDDRLLLPPEPAQRVHRPARRRPCSTPCSGGAASSSRPSDRLTTGDRRGAGTAVSGQRRRLTRDSFRINSTAAGSSVEGRTSMRPGHLRLLHELPATARSGRR